MKTLMIQCSAHPGNVVIPARDWPVSSHRDVNRQPFPFWKQFKMKVKGYSPSE